MSEAKNIEPETKEDKNKKDDTVIPLEVRCKDCYHYKKEAAERYTDICANLGRLPITRPCSAFLVDVNSFSLKTPLNKSFAEILKEIPTTKLAAFAALLTQERASRKQGFRHGEEVYVRIYPNDFLSNYVKAWVLLAKRGRVIVQGKKTNFRASLLINSVLTKEQYAKKRIALISRKRIKDPDLKKHTTWRPKFVNKTLATYEPPTIDDISRPDIRQKPKIKQEGDTTYIRGKNVDTEEN